MHPTELLERLAHFTGSGTFARHGLVRTVVMTEGVQFLAEAASAHWLTDAVASYQHDAKVRAEGFQVWTLAVDDGMRRGSLVMTDGHSSNALVRQNIAYTDFPIHEITLWLIADGEHQVLMLPQEY
jgi:hypothetical protein